MTLIDAGPLVALLDDDDAHHAACLAVARKLPAGPLQTTWPCFTEVRSGDGRLSLPGTAWKMRREGRLALFDLTPAEIDRMDSLIARYANVPMDLADASLVAVAESRAFRRLFTIDSDFYIYRLADGSVLEILP